MNVFIDSDVILDLLMSREGHMHEASLIFSEAEKKGIKLYTSSLVICNVHYLLRRKFTSKIAVNQLIKLRSLVTIRAVDDKIINQALASDFADFEDAVQHFTAINNNIRLICTRNISDYKKSEIEVVTPGELLKRLK